MISRLNPSPEPLERVVARIENRCGFDAMADPEACLRDSYEAADAIRALAAENDRLRAECDEQRSRAQEAESQITRAQEQVSAEFEGDCWKALRNLLDRTGFDWSEYSEDGVTASEAQEWIEEELDRLEAAIDAAWQAGAEAMRKAAANVASNTCLVPPDGGSPTEEERAVCEQVCRRVLALPLPRQPKENDA